MTLAKGKVITACGPIEAQLLGRVMMHEHLYGDAGDFGCDEPITVEKPITQERREMLMRDAIPFLKQCNEHGCHAFVDASPSPFRAWPTFYPEAAQAAQMHIILSTGFYREVEVGTYWARTPALAIWPFVRQASIEELAEFCIQEIVTGIRGTAVHAGAIKLGSSQPQMTQAEEKAFRAGARAQKATGVHITTHCTQTGAIDSQLRVLDSEGVDLTRVAIGHTAWAMSKPEGLKICIDWMKRGANFLPTNMGIGKDGGENWRPLVEAIHTVFDAGLGNRIAGFGLDWGFGNESGAFGPCTFIPPPPYLHMFTHTLPAFRKMGLTAAEEETILRTNPQRLLPVQ